MLTTLLLLLGPAARAATLRVGPSEPYTIIQDAIDAAASGDIIEILSGTYAECLSVRSKSIELRGEGPEKVEVRPPSGCSEALRVGTGIVLTVADLAITNPYRRGIYSDADQLIVEGVWITDSGWVAVNGAGIYLAAGALVVRNSRLSGNTGYEGAAIYMASDTSAELLSVEFDDNRASETGGAIRMSRGATLEATDCTFTEQFAPRHGGAICGGGDNEVVLRSTRFERNQGDRGGVVYLSSGGSLTVEECRFSDNVARSGGGDLYLSSLNEVTIDRSGFSGSSAGRTGGGAIYVESEGASVRLSDSWFYQTEAEGDGGALLVRAGSTFVTGSSFEEGLARGNGGAVALVRAELDMQETVVRSNTALDSGGGLWISGWGSRGASLLDSVLQDNEAANGGGLWASDLAMLSADRLLLLGNRSISGSGVGGGLAAQRCQVVEIRDSWFCQNQSGGRGGGVWFEGDSPYHTVTSLFQDNVFADNQADSSHGGALDWVDEPTWTSAEFRFVNNTLMGNSAPTGMGGGLRVSSGWKATLIGNAIVGTHSGGGIAGSLPTSAMEGDVGYNLWYDNTEDHGVGSLSGVEARSGSLVAEPLFADYSDDGDCSNDDLRPSLGSPLTDAGDPRDADEDGSRADIGARTRSVPVHIDDDGDGVVHPRDCDDEDADVHPGAEERCNGWDDDCDGQVDVDAVDALVWYLDQDGDGHGDPSQATLACEEPPGYAAAGTDCDDADPDVHPGAEERCNDKDDDCDGVVDDDAVDPLLLYLDEDGDGFGAGAVVAAECSVPDGHALNDADCDDDDPLVSPDGRERCNGIDDDCDGLVDADAEDATRWYEDADGDGYGASDRAMTSCEQPSGFVAEPGDCNDADPLTFPGAPEFEGDGLDQDCDGRDTEPAPADGGATVDGGADEDSGSPADDPDKASSQCRSRSRAPSSAGLLLLLPAAWALTTRSRARR